MSTETGKLIKNFVALLSVNIVRPLNFFSTLFIAWQLGPDLFGPFSTAVLETIAISILINFGLDNLIVREIARNQQQSNLLIGDALILKLLSLPVGALLLGFFVLTISSPHTFPLYAIMILYSILNSYLLFVCAVFRGLEKMRFQAYLASAQMVLIALGSSIIVWQTKNILIIASIYPILTSIMLWIGFKMLIQQGVKPIFRWSPQLWQRLLRTTLPFGVIMIGLVTYDRQSVTIISIISGSKAAGWFNAVYSFLIVFLNIPTLMSSILLPVLARRSQEGYSAITKICAQVIRYSNLIAFPLAAGFSALASFLVPLLFGPLFANSIPLMQVMSLSLPFIFLVIIQVAILQCLDQQRNCAISIGLVWLIIVPLTVLTTMRLGYQGGAFIYPISHFLLAGVLFYLMQRKLGWLSPQKTLLPPVLGSVSMWLFIYFSREYSVSILIILPVAGLLYLMLIVLTGGIEREEITLLRNVLPRFRLPSDSTS